MLSSSQIATNVCTTSPDLERNNRISMIRCGLSVLIIFIFQALFQLRVPDPESAGDPRHRPASGLLGGRHQARPRVPGGGGGDHGNSPVGGGGQAAHSPGAVYWPGTVRDLYKQERACP